MISYAEAVALLMEAAHKTGHLPVEDVPLSQALSRVAAGRLLSLESLPRFANSAMDGYALRSKDAPGRLSVSGTVCAGDKPPRALKPGTACEIMTGAALPPGADAVVPVEFAEKADDGRAVLVAAAHAGDFVRQAGQDFEEGGIIAEAGTCLSAKHILALAALGAAKVPVRRRPRVAVLSTGRELVPAENNPKPGQIRDASGPYLLAALAEAGCEPAFHGIVRDDVPDFRRRIKKILSARPDVVLTTGAVSMGKHDFVTAEIQRLGARLLFHKTATRPGKPLLAARFERGPLFFGLPGNPIATVVGLRFFVLPFLRERLEMPPEQPLKARLSVDVEKPDGLRCFFKARLEGQKARVLQGQGSFQIHSLLGADAWAVLPETGSRCRAGTLIDVFPLS
jgi:molybdopterin molybdotransferase